MAFCCDGPTRITQAVTSVESFGFLKILTIVTLTINRTLCCHIPFSQPEEGMVLLLVDLEKLRCRHIKCLAQDHNKQGEELGPKPRPWDLWVLPTGNGLKSRKSEKTENSKEVVTTCKPPNCRTLPGLPVALSFWNGKIMCVVIHSTNIYNGFLCAKCCMRT